MWYTFHWSQREAIRTLDSLGIPHGKARFWGHCNIRVAKGGKMSIGENFVCQSGSFACIDCQNESKLQVEECGCLQIGNNVGMSNVIIHCWNHVMIEDDVKIGAGCMIFDTNFHNTDADTRCTTDDRKTITTAPVVIKKQAFIGHVA